MIQASPRIACVYNQAHIHCIAPRRVSARLRGVAPTMHSDEADASNVITASPTSSIH
jgi:hypothetical protein